MREFSKIYDLAVRVRGNAKTVEENLRPLKPLSKAKIAAIPADRLLAAMTRRIFQAGFVWRVIVAKWDGFEAAFETFDVQHCAHLNDRDFEALVADTRIIRHAQKIHSVRMNAQFLLEMEEEFGGGAKMLAQWPDTDYVGLLAFLKKRAHRIGGQSGMWFLRSIGKPSFILTQDVVTALVREGVVEGEPTSKRDLAAVQAAFNEWAEQSGRDLTALSRILALSVGNVAVKATHPGLPRDLPVVWGDEVAD